MLSQIHVPYRLAVALTLAASIGLTAAIPPALGAQAKTAAPRGYRVKTQTSKTLSVVVFNTPDGAIDVYLPLDLQVGDATLVTVALVPRGHIEPERSAEAAALGSCSLVLGDQEAQASQSVRRWNVTTGSSGGVDLTLKATRNREAEPVVMTVTVPIGAAVGANATEAGGHPAMPARGTAGQPLALPRLAAADADDVAVLIGGKPAALMAASPRGLVVGSPGDVIGKTMLVMKQGDRTLYEGAFRNDRLHRRTNPWPYVIGAAVVVGVVIAIAYIELANAFSHLTFPGNPSGL